MTPSMLQKDFKIPLVAYVLGAILLGVTVGKIWTPQCIDWVIYFALLLMLFPPMLEVDFGGVTRVFKEPRLVTAALLLNFLVSPLLIFGLLQLFVRGNDGHLMVGIILYGAVPGGGMAPAFTGMLKGNVNLTVTIAAIGSILSLGIVPLWAKLLTGTQMEVPALLIFEHLCFIIVIPLILAVLTRRIIVWKKGESTFCSVKERLKPLSNLGLFLILFAMSLLYGDRVLSEPFFVLKIAAPVSAFLAILFLISGAIGKAFGAPYEDAIALTLSTTAKNNAISLALAFSTFGADAGLVNAIAGPLVQLPILLAFVALRKGNTT
ncbi:MAG: arsenic resistance protein [Thermodesulfobacteriota bacterium]